MINETKAEMNNICPTCGRPYKVNVDEVRKLYSAGRTMGEIAEIFGVTKQSIWRYLQGKEFAEIKKKNIRRGIKAGWVKRGRIVGDE